MQAQNTSNTIYTYNSHYRSVQPIQHFCQLIGIAKTVYILFTLYRCLCRTFVFIFWIMDIFLYLAASLQVEKLLLTSSSKWSQTPILFINSGKLLNTVRFRYWSHQHIKDSETLSRCTMSATGSQSASENISLLTLINYDRGKRAVPLSVVYLW